MNLEDFGQSFEIHGEEVVDENMSQNSDIDVRRRLEDKIEEMRLQRELKDFDFDF